MKTDWQVKRRGKIISFVVTLFVFLLFQLHASGALIGAPEPMALSGATVPFIYAVGGLLGIVTKLLVGALKHGQKKTFRWWRLFEPFVYSFIPSALLLLYVMPTFGLPTGSPFHDFIYALATGFFAVDLTDDLVAIRDVSLKKYHEAMDGPRCSDRPDGRSCND
jgi:hypothetical protein